MLRLLKSSFTGLIHSFIHSWAHSCPLHPETINWAPAALGIKSKPVASASPEPCLRFISSWPVPPAHLHEPAACSARCLLSLPGAWAPGGQSSGLCLEDPSLLQGSTHPLYRSDSLSLSWSGSLQGILACLTGSGACVGPQGGCASRSVLRTCASASVAAALAAWCSSLGACHHRAGLWCDWLWFTPEEREAQRGQATYPRAHRQAVDWT